MSWVTNLFDKAENSSKEKAKKRLKLVLMHDRASISPQIMEKLKVELVDVIKKYVDIDSKHSEITLNENKRTVALIANFPIKGVREKAMQ